MTTQQIADRLIELARAGDYDAAYDELFAPDFIGVGPAGSKESEPVQGIEAMKEKGKEWGASMEKFLGSRISDPLVAGDVFVVKMGFECVYKGNTDPSKEEELIVYEVKNGKIFKETYFYAV